MNNYDSKSIPKNDIYITDIIIEKQFIENSKSDRIKHTETNNEQLI